MKQKKTELLAEHFAFVFIELTLFEVIHMNLLVMRAHSLSLPPLHTIETFSRIRFCILLNRVQKTHIVHFDASVCTHSVRETHEAVYESTVSLPPAVHPFS